MPSNGPLQAITPPPSPVLIVPLTAITEEKTCKKKRPAPLFIYMFYI